MSLYVIIVCDSCREQLWLGKRLEPKGAEPRLVIGDRAASEDELRTRALWKMLAVHAQHGLRVLTDASSDYDSAAGYREIGGDEVTDISLQAYLIPPDPNEP
jgi:N-formylglutamate amidohydrolase